MAIRSGGRAFFVAAAFAILTWRADPVAAESFALSQCGGVGGLTDKQVEFAASVSLLSDRRRREQLGLDGVLGEIDLCAAQVRHAVCAGKGILGLLDPRDSVLGGAAFGLLGGRAGGAMGAVVWGSLGATVVGWSSATLQMRACDARREALAKSADLLTLSRAELGANPRLLDYPKFNEILRRHVPHVLDRETAEVLSRAARELAKATLEAAR